MEREKLQPEKTLKMCNKFSDIAFAVITQP